MINAWRVSELLTEPVQYSILYDDDGSGPHTPPRLTELDRFRAKRRTRTLLVDKAY
jgi:hypothetical protein